MSDPGPYLIWIGHENVRINPPSRAVPQSVFDLVMRNQYNTIAPTDPQLMKVALSAYCAYDGRPGNRWDGVVGEVHRGGDGDMIFGRVGGTPVWLKVPITEGPW